MYKYNNTSKKPQYIIVALIIFTFIIAYSYMGLSHKNSIVVASYEEKINDLEGRLQASIFQYREQAQNNPEVRILNSKLANNVKEIDILQERLAECKKQRLELEETVKSKSLQAEFYWQL